jgi:hypothetical protein
MLPVLAAGRPRLAQGVNFRQTSGYVSDPAGSTYSIGASYPATVGAATGGWTTAPSGFRDRVTSSDPRLAGVAFRSIGGPAASFRLDVPPGPYLVRLAMGDRLAQYSSKIQVLDDTASRLILDDSAAVLGRGMYMDATGVIRSTASAWVSDNRPAELMITTGILRLALLAPNPSLSFASVIAHISVTTP